MGKKVEKAFKDKSVSSAQHESQDDGTKSPEPYVCTGKFHDDFIGLCEQAHMPYSPPVISRARRPGTPPPPSEFKPEKGTKEKGKKGVVETLAPPSDSTPPIAEEGDGSDPPPKTYLVKERFDYFKPTIQVEMDNPEKHDTVTEVHIRGWRIDDPMMNILKQCWVCSERLNTISLWNVGLTDETLALLGSILPSCSNMKSLVLEGNTPPIRAENYHVLLLEGSPLVNLALRHNQISDIGVKNIANILGNYKTPNTKLISLNLASNHIGDAGAAALAEALRMNRTLLNISLANNRISDSGAKSVAQTISRFPLNHEEIIERRKLKSEKGLGADGTKSPSPSRRAESKERPMSQRSPSHAGKDKRDKSSKKKDEKGDAKGGTKGKGKDAEKQAAAKKDAAKGGKAPASEATRATKGKDKKGGKGQTKEQGPLEQEPETLDLLSPLMETAESIGDQLWIPGNRMLLSLNLQRNQITLEGVKAFKLALQYQDTLLSEGPKTLGTGLMRLVLNKNNIPSNSDELNKLSELLLRRDPYYKPPPTPVNDEEATEKSR